MLWALIAYSCATVLYTAWMPSKIVCEEAARGAWAMLSYYEGYPRSPQDMVTWIGCLPAENLSDVIDDGGEICSVP
mgnify:CR=1 FL=1